MNRRTLTLEIWKVEEVEGVEYALCYAGPLGDDSRACLHPGAQLLTTIEAGCHFEAMTLYYRFLGWGEYTSDQEWDRQPYPDEWFLAR